MSGLCRGEPAARSAQAGGGAQTQISTDLTSQIIRDDAAVRATYNTPISMSTFREALDQDNIILAEYRKQVSELLVTDYSTAGMCASIRDDEVRELLADVSGMRVRTAVVRYVVRMVHTIPAVRRYMVQFNMESTALSISRSVSMGASKRARSQFRYPSESRQDDTVGAGLSLGGVASTTSPHVSSIHVPSAGYMGDTGPAVAANGQFAAELPVFDGLQTDPQVQAGLALQSAVSAVENTAQEQYSELLSRHARGSISPGGTEICKVMLDCCNACIGAASSLKC